MKRAFASTADDAGLPDVTPHTLRHTAATWLMQLGVDPWAASGYLGMSLVTLTRGYAHHHPDHLPKGGKRRDRLQIGGKSCGRNLDPVRAFQIKSLISFGGR